MNQEAKQEMCTAHSEWENRKWQDSALPPVSTPFPSPVAMSVIAAIHAHYQKLFTESRSFKNYGYNL